MLPLGGEDAPEHLWRVAAEPGHDPGIEALDAEIPVPGVQDPERPPAELLPPGAALQLHDHGTGSFGEHVQDFREQGDALISIQEFHFLQFVITEAVHIPSLIAAIFSKLSECLELSFILSVSRNTQTTSIHKPNTSKAFLIEYDNERACDALYPLQADIAMDTTARYNNPRFRFVISCPPPIF